MPFIADEEELTGRFIPDDELSAPESKGETELSKVSPARPQSPENWTYESPEVQDLVRTFQERQQGTVGPQRPKGAMEYLQNFFAPSPAEQAGVDSGAITSPAITAPRVLAAPILGIMEPYARKAQQHIPGLTPHVPSYSESQPAISPQAIEAFYKSTHPLENYLLSKAPEVVRQSVGAVGEQVGEIASGMTSQEAVKSLPTYATPILGPLMMAKEGVEGTATAAAETIEAAKQGDLIGMLKAGTRTLANATMLVPGVAGTVKAFTPKPSPKVVPPKAAELFSRTKSVLPRSTEAARAIAEKPIEVTSEVIAETPISEVPKVSEAAAAKVPATPTEADWVAPSQGEGGWRFTPEFVENASKSLTEPSAYTRLVDTGAESGKGGFNAWTQQLSEKLRAEGDAAIPKLKAALESYGIEKANGAEVMKRIGQMTTDQMQSAMNRMQSVQIPREIFEGATQTGSWADRTGLKGQPIKPTPELVALYEQLQGPLDLGPHKATEPMVTLYNGGDTQWFTTNPQQAAGYGPVRSVQVPKSVADAAQAEVRNKGVGTPGYKLPKEWSDKAADVPVEAPVIELESELKSKQPEGGAIPSEKVQGQVQGKEEIPQEVLAAESGQRSPPQETAPSPVPEEATTATPVAGSTPKWTSATSEPALTLKQIAEGKQPPRAGEAGFVDVGAIIDSVYDMAKRAGKAVGEGVRAVGEIGKEALTLPATSDLRRSVLGWSSKLQRSFNESAQAQKEIMQKVPDAIKREGITNWIQAGGDAAILQQRAAASSNPKLKAGYEAALNLTPDELAVAAEVKAAFDALGLRGQAADVLNNFRENYTPQIWDLKKGPQFAGSRTLRDRFRFSKARVFESFAEGEQAGFVPKTKDIAKLLPVYLHEMNTVIAARQLVSDMAQGVASDGRPLVAPRGAELPVDNAQGKASLVIPKMPKGADTLDYKVLENQPALTDWRWLSKDAEGNNRFIKADLALHPEALSRMKAALGKSAIREWYQSQGSLGAAIPKVIAKAIDNAQSGTKKTMLGLLAPFHQVQEGTHAVGHRVNPFFNIPKVDLVKDVAQLDATKHGLMLAPDRASANQFMEGLTTSGLVSKIPGIGKLADHYSHYLFHEYIPGLKYKTYEAILERNNGVFEKQLKSGEVKPEDVKILSAEQANAAYGHLNYADLGRNPTIQHMMQLGLLAPDFLEARARFAGQSIKGTTGAKVGREQMLALGTLAVAQAVTAWTAAQLTDGEWDAKHPFEFRKGNRKYTMRSVPEDIAGLISNTRSFVHSRLSPVVGKAGLQYLTGVDWAGRPVSAAKTTQQAATQFIPLNLRGFEWVRDFMGESPIGGLSPLEQVAGSVGLRISRYRAGSEVGKLAGEFNEAQGIPRGRWVSEEPTGYALLRDALHKQGQKNPMEALQELRKTKKDADIFKGFQQSRTRPFTGSAEREGKFKASLTPQQRALYDSAKAERERDYQAFLDLWRNKPPRP